MNKILEEHAIRVEINIKAASFRVAPPEKVSFSVALDGKTLAQSRKSYQVDNDHCLVFEKLNFEITAIFDARKNMYLSRQITLYVHYEGNMGREGRRYVKFEPLSNGSPQRDWRLPIEGTPDFQIEFSSGFNVLSKKSKVTQVSSNVNDFLFNGNTKREFNAERKTSAINELVRTEADFKKSQVKDNFANKTRKLQNYKSVPMDAKKRGVKNRVGSPKYAQESDETAKPKDQLQNLRRKIEQQREEKVRSISKLKMEISPIFSGQFEKNEDIIQAGKLKEKIRNYQRKEKSLLTSIQELTSQLQKRKLKIGQLQTKRLQLQKGISERDIKLKSAQSTIRTLNQQIEGLATKQKTSSKKGQVKQATLREQIRKLQEKLRLADVQIAKTNEQKNSTIKSVQFCQKIHQNALRQKDIKISQQKAKIVKIREQFMLKQKQSTSKMQQFNLKVQNLEFQKNQTQERISLLNGTIFNLQNEINALRQSIKLQRQKTQRRMEQHSDKAYGDINSARIKYNDLTTQNNLLKQKMKRLQVLNTQNEKRIKELEESIKAKNSQITKNSNKINSFKNDIDALNEQNIRKIRQIQGLKQTNNILNKKLAQIKQKYDQERLRREDTHNALERSNIQFNRQAQAYETQIKDLKWTIVRNNDTISELQYQIKQQNNTILKLNEENMTKTQKNTAFQQNLRQSIHENQQVERQKNMFMLKVKELNEIIRIKNMEFDEEKKLRIKAQQRVQDEKEKNRQYINFHREKQNQQYQRIKQKEVNIARKQEQINSLQLELTKRKEQITSLKNSFQSALRQIQLCKLDSDTLKSQHNLMESNFKTLNVEHSNLIKIYESLNIKLTTNEQNLAMQIKKYQQLQKQFEQYKEEIERALQNLLLELFKEETNNSNIIAATLFPFPTQKLSNLQIQLVQKRNNFIIKSRQKISDLENQVDLIKHQLQQLTHMYENREEAAKRLDCEQRQKLKGLLYENMLEKNGLNEDLVIERKQREQLQKEIQKLKGQIFRRHDIEQQLNGQLQLLILQYEGVKAENQDLNLLLFKHKQMEIKNSSEFEHRLTIQQEQSTIQIDKLKVEGLEREKKIIQLEKDLLELNEKTRKLQDQKLKINGVLQLSKQTNRILEDKLSYSNIEITKLNNTVKGIQKRQSACRDTIEKLQNQVSQLRNKCEVLQSSLNTATSQHFETNIEKQRLSSQFSNLKQRFAQLQKVLHEKGEVSKQRIQKKMDEISQLKSALIQKNSDLQLKEFHIKQRQQQYQTLHEEYQDLKKANTVSKNRIKQLIHSLQSSQTKVKQLSRDIEQLVQQRIRKDDTLSQSNFFIMSLQNELEEMNQLNFIVQAKEKQCIQLRQAKSEAEQYYMNEVKKNKEIITSLKKQLKNQKVNLENLENEYKVNLQNLSKTNHQRCKSLETDFLHQKDDFSKKVQQIENHNRRVVSQFEFRIQKFKEDLQDAKQNQRVMTEECLRKDSALKNLTKRYQQHEADLEDFKHKYNKYYHLYLQNKAELGQSLKQNQSKFLNNMQKSKASQLKEYSFKLGELERKLQRLKHVEQMQLKSQTLTRREIKLLIDKIFNKLSEYIKEAEIQAQELWQASRIDSHVY